MTTPLFHHLGSSSWHGDDVAILNKLLKWVKGPIGWIIFITFVIIGAGISIIVKEFIWKKRKLSNQSLLNKYHWIRTLTGNDESENLYVLLEVASTTSGEEFDEVEFRDLPSDHLSNERLSR